jgi:hypothetical protein
MKKVKKNNSIFSFPWALVILPFILLASELKLEKIATILLVIQISCLAAQLYLAFKKE